MKIEGYHRFIFYSLVATAFASLVLTGELDAVSVILYSMAVAVSIYADLRNVGWLRLPGWLWKALGVAYIPFFFVDSKLVSSWGVALAHLTLFASAATLLRKKRDRDWVFLFLVAVFQMLLTAGLTFNAMFAGSLVVFIFFFVSALSAFEMRRAQRETASVDEEVITSPMPISAGSGRGDHQSTRELTGRVRYLIGASVAQVVMVALLTLPLFFLIPRFGSGGIARGFGGGQAISGFSSEVRLGQIARIKQGQRVVMRVELSRGPGRTLRWHGISLDHYDGTTWTTTLKDPSVEKRGGSAGGVDLSADPNFEWSYSWVGNKPANAGSLIQQRFVLEPEAGDTVFAARRLVGLRGPLPKILVRDASHGAGDDLVSVTSEGVSGRVQYTAWSDVNTPSDQELRADATAEETERLSRPYTELLVSLRGYTRLDPRIKVLAREITRAAPTAYDKARAIEGYLKTHFGYTLNLRTEGLDPLAYFLFESREGHCEYFATAMAVMLRTLGIPCRIANGFQMGEYNDINNLYVVRERDAHSWVEVYFPHADAWVEFDPTPAAGINDYSQGGLIARLRKYVDAAEVFWLDYIVTLDRDQQASIMVDLQQKLLAVRDWVKGRYVAATLTLKRFLNSALIDRRWNTREFLIAIALAAMLALSGLGIYVATSYLKQRGRPPTGYGPWWHRLFVLPTWKRSSLRTGEPRRSAILFYEQMLAIAARKGYVKRPEQTPLEFAAESGFAAIREITLVYNRVRFGGTRLDETDAGRVAALLGEIRSTKNN
jgi:protein-glutamine gamma-glutamyltransferase